METKKPTLLGCEADRCTGSEFRNLNPVLNPDLTSQLGSRKEKFQFEIPTHVGEPFQRSVHHGCGYGGPSGSDAGGKLGLCKQCVCVCGGGHRAGRANQKSKGRLYLPQRAQRRAGRSPRDGGKRCEEAATLVRGCKEGKGEQPWR